MQLEMLHLTSRPAPTAFTNGPVFIESQVDVVVDFLKRMESEDIRSIEAQRTAEERWKNAIQEANNKTLLPLTDSWYMGANIPGKPREQLNYLGGIENYERECREALATFEGFTVVRDAEDRSNGCVKKPSIVTVPS